MKLNIVFLGFVFCVLSFFNPAIGQSGDIPPFKILRTNGSFFTVSDVKKNKPVVLIYFAPDCGHCLTLLDGVFKKMADFKKAELLLITFKPVEELAFFEKKYKTASYPNITTGTEGNTFFLRNFYKMQKTPFTALFDRQGRLVRTYNDEKMIDDLVGRVKKIN